MQTIVLSWHENGQPESKTINLKKPRLIGRHPDCDVVLADQTVSRYHVELSRQNGRLQLHNKSQAARTVINGRRLLTGDTALLEDGQTLTLGAIQLQVSIIGKGGRVYVRCLNCNRAIPLELKECNYCGYSLAGAETTFAEQ